MSRPHHISAIGAGGPEHLRDGPGGREGGGEEGRGCRSLGLIWIVHRIQMSHVLVTDHLTGPRWAERMSCDAKDASYS